MLGWHKNSWILSIGFRRYQGQDAAGGLVWMQNASHRLIHLVSTCLMWPLGSPCEGHYLHSFKAVRLKYHILSRYPSSTEGGHFCVFVRERVCVCTYTGVSITIRMKCVCNVILYTVRFWFHQEHLFHWNQLFCLGSGCVCLCWPWIASGTVRRLLMGFLMAIVMKKSPGYCSAPWEMYWQRRYSTPVWTVYTCATRSLPPIGVFCTHTHTQSWFD